MVGAAYGRTIPLFVACPKKIGFCGVVLLRRVYRVRNVESGEHLVAHVPTPTAIQTNVVEGQPLQPRKNPEHSFPAHLFKFRTANRFRQVAVFVFLDRTVDEEQPTRSVIKLYE